MEKTARENWTESYLWLDRGCLSLGQVLAGRKGQLTDTALEHLLSGRLANNQLHLHLRVQHQPSNIHTKLSIPRADPVIPTKLLHLPTCSDCWKMLLNDATNQHDKQLIKKHCKWKEQHITGHFRDDLTGHMTQPTVSQHWRMMVSQPRQEPIPPGSAH